MTGGVDWHEALAEPPFCSSPTGMVRGVSRRIPQNRGVGWGTHDEPSKTPPHCTSISSPYSFPHPQKPFHAPISPPTKAILSEVEVRSVGWKKAMSHQERSPFWTASFSSEPRNAFLFSSFPARAKAYASSALVYTWFSSPFPAVSRQNRALRTTECWGDGDTKTRQQDVILKSILEQQELYGIHGPFTTLAHCLIYTVPLSFPFPPGLLPYVTYE